MKMTKSFEKFIEEMCNARELHLFDACNMYVEKQERVLIYVLQDLMDFELVRKVEKVFLENIDAAKALKQKILESTLFWDEVQDHPEETVYLTLKVIPLDLEDMRLSFHGCRVKEGYIYKDVISRRTDWSSGLPCIYTSKKLMRTKIADLPEVDHNLLEKFGANISPWCLDEEDSDCKIPLPEWEEVSIEDIGHEYPDQDQYNY